MSPSPPQSPAPPAPTRAQARTRRQKEKEAKEKEAEEKEEKEVEGKEEENAKGVKGKGKGKGKGSKEKEEKEKEKEKEKGPKAKGSKAKAAPPAVPTRVQPAREKRNPQYGGTRDTVEGPAPAAASPGVGSNASRADSERDGRMDVDVPRAHSPSYADVVRASSPSRASNGGSPSSAGPPGNPPSSARGTTAPSTSGRLVLDHVAAPQPSRGMPDRRAQATSRDSSASTNAASPTAQPSSSESSGTSQSSFETPSPSSSEGEEPSPPEPAKKAASKRSRDTPPSPATAPPLKKVRAGPLHRAPITGATPANAQSKTKRARSPSTQDVAPARKKSKKDIAEGHSKGAGAMAPQGKAVDGRGKEGKGKDKERPRPKPKAGAKAKEPAGMGTGVGGRGKGATAKGGSGKGTDGAGSKASFGEEWLGSGEGYVAPVTPPRPLQLIDFDPDDFIMPTPPPKPGNGKKPALASLNERDTPPPSPTKKQKKQREGTHPPPKTTQRHKAQSSRRSPSRSESPQPSSSRRASPPPTRKNKKVRGGSSKHPTEEHAAKDDRRPGAPPPPPPPPKKKDNGGDSDDDDDDDDGVAPPPSQKAKGKQRADPEDDEEAGEFDEGALPIHLPGVFDSGDFMDDDSPLPDLSGSTVLKGSGEPDLGEPGPSTRRLNAAGSSTARKADKFNAGPVPSTTTQCLQDAVRRLTDTITAESIKCKKPAESLWAAAGWTSFDYMRTRRWTRQQVFSRHWSATNPTVDGETKEKRMARMNKAYKKKLARAGSDPSEEQLVELFKDDWDFCADLQEQLIENATARQRQRLVNQTAEQLSRLALGSYLNSGLAMVGYVVDLRGGAKGAVNSSMFGGGPEYTEMLRRYKGNFSAGMNDVTTLLRSCDLRLRGLADDTETPPLVAAVPPAGDEESL